MEQLDCLNWKAQISLVSYGIHIGIRTNQPTLLEHLPDYLPPGWQPSRSPVVEELYTLIECEITQDCHNHVYYQLYHDREQLAETSELDQVFNTLDSDLRLRIGKSVTDKLFVHAGVVSWRDRAIVIPGRSFSGKTTLVIALVKAGAIYYSDEYAVFDTNGMVHPYSRALSVRQKLGEQVKRLAVQELGGKSGTKPLPVGLLVLTHYQPEAQWCPSVISPGQAVLALLDNTLVARLRPQLALPILTRAVSSALRLKGNRGEAQDVAVKLLKQLEDWINAATIDSEKIQ